MERQDRYPRPVKILSQYVFIPLVSFNAVILYAYAVEILADVRPARRAACESIASFDPWKITAGWKSSETGCLTGKDPPMF